MFPIMDVHNRVIGFGGRVMGDGAQPSAASPELAYYDKGMSVRYDKVLTADGHTWLSYVTYSGSRRYVDVS